MLLVVVQDSVILAASLLVRQLVAVLLIYLYYVDGSSLETAIVQCTSKIDIG